eukprot:562241-Pelagomonas_calceolata.AAC.3
MKGGSNKCHRDMLVVCSLIGLSLHPLPTVSLGPLCADTQWMAQPSVWRATLTQDCLKTHTGGHFAPPQLETLVKGQPVAFGQRVHVPKIGSANIGMRASLLKH